jgi:hypothetical protein
MMVVMVGTMSVWSVNVCTHWPLAASHTLTVLSADLDRNVCGRMCAAVCAKALRDEQDG